MGIAIQSELSVNRVFNTPEALLEHAEYRAEHSPKLDCESNAYTLMVRIEAHPRGFKLVEMFYLDDGLVEQELFYNDDLYTFRDVENLVFAESEQ